MCSEPGLPGCRAPQSQGWEQQRQEDQVAGEEAEGQLPGVGGGGGQAHLKGRGCPGPQISPVPIATLTACRELSEVRLPETPLHFLCDLHHFRRLSEQLLPSSSFIPESPLLKTPKKKATSVFFFNCAFKRISNRVILHTSQTRQQVL